MDDQRFDALSRLLAGARTRRAVAPTMAGVIAGFVAALGGENDAEARQKQQRKQKLERQHEKKKKKPKCLKTGTRCTRKSGGKGDHCRNCCTGVATRRPGGGGRCACKGEGTACTADQQCCNRACTGGECGPCDPGQSLCPTGCVDLQTNDDHCGSCGNDCGAEEGCCGGTCTDLTTDQNCGACGTVCTAPQFCEAGSCVDPRCGNGAPCRVFVTSTVQTGALGGLAGADAICQQLAEAADLPGTYLAWLSSSTAWPRSRFPTQSQEPYQLVDGTVIATNWSDLTDRSLLAPINRDETGATRSLEVWTETTAGGLGFAGSACGDWTVASSGGSARAGLSESTTDDWSFVYLQFCDRPLALYCFQQS